MDNIPFLNLEYFFLLIYNLVTGESAGALPEQAYAFWSLFQIFSAILSALLFFGIAYTVVRIWQIRKEEVAVYGSRTLSQSKPLTEDVNKRWEKIMELASSENPKEWKLAILEADVLLDELVIKMGYQGENLGERMKGIEGSDFTTLEQAWEAHKVRNTIAHSSSDFILTQREARRIMDLYKQVFEEFEFI